MKNNTKQTLKIYWHHARNYKVLLFWTIFSTMGATVVGSIIPLYSKSFFDVIASGGNKDRIVISLTHILVILAGFEGLRWVSWRIAGYTSSRLQPAVISDLSIHAFSELHKHTFAYFNNNFVGSLVKRVNWFVRAFEVIADQITWNLLPLVTNIAVIIIVLGKKSLYLSLGIIVWLVTFLAINWLLVKYKLKFDLERNEAETKATAILADTITNNHNVKLFVGYDREVKSFRDASEKVRFLRAFTWNLDNIYEGVQAFLTVALDLGITFLGVKLWRQNLLTIGDFVLLQAYVVMIFEKTWGFGKMIRYIYSSLADAEEMTILLGTPIEVENKFGAKEILVSKGEITFTNVGFNYNETRSVLTHLNLAIHPNEKVALVGPSGSGKTTLIKLLLRMYDVTEGTIAIDGMNISEITKESLWSNISLVPQDPILFHRSLMENIRYGKPFASDEEVIAASKLAHCHDFITELPDGYNTFVGERGIKLSGGERQRVAIARAILRNAPILILDEATSSLDSESEALIQDALAELMKNKTVIVIAHRLSTIMKMDRIIVVNRGEVIEEGTHTELLKNEAGIYSNLWKIQAGGFFGDEKTDKSDSLNENLSVLQD